MKTVGIVSEYNPFHNGHKYHIQAAKEACGADFCICIMSGNFVQRGEPSIFDKWSRAKMAVMNGADLVVELPVVFACQPAEIFALGAVKILNGMDIVDHLCFGSELGDTDTLNQLAELLHQEPEAFKRLLREYLDEGASYPNAISRALSTYLGKEQQSINDDILKNPNNVLGIEYIKALISLKSKIEPIAVKRIASGYNDKCITGSIASATAVRAEIKNSGISEAVRRSVPENVLPIIEDLIHEGRHPLYLNDFSDILLYRLRLTEEAELTKYLNVREGIENRLKKCSHTSSDCEELIEAVKTKRYTRTYIQRLLCHLLLDIKKSDVAIFKNLNCPAFIRILAFNENGTKLIKEVKKRSAFPVISKVADFDHPNVHIKKMFAYDIAATNIYNLAYRTHSHKKGMEDYLTSPYYHRG